MGPNGSTAYAANEPALAFGRVREAYLVAWHGDDNILPLSDDELEIFGQLYLPTVRVRLPLVLKG